MAFSESLAARIRDALARKKNVEEKKMFGGIGFLLSGNMLVGVWKDSLIVRLGPDEGEEALKEPHANPTSAVRGLKDHDSSCFPHLSPKSWHYILLRLAHARRQLQTLR
jgi:TfoX N-terminal domain